MGSEMCIRDSLVDAHPVGDEPVIDHAQLSEWLPRDTRFFPYLAARGVPLVLVRLDVPLRHGPQQTPAPVQPPDESDVDLRHVNGTVRRNCLRHARNDEAARARFVARFHVLRRVLRVFVRRLAVLIAPAAAIPAALIAALVAPLVIAPVVASPATLAAAILVALLFALLVAVFFALILALILALALVLALVIVGAARRAPAAFAPARVVLRRIRIAGGFLSHLLNRIGPW